MQNHRQSPEIKASTRSWVYVLRTPSSLNATSLDIARVKGQFGIPRQSLVKIPVTEHLHVVSARLVSVLNHYLIFESEAVLDLVFELQEAEFRRHSDCSAFVPKPYLESHGTRRCDARGRSTWGLMRRIGPLGA